MKCPSCKGEGLERLFFEEGDWHHDPTAPCEECDGHGEITNYELFKDKECKIWRGDEETPENLIFGFDKEDIESIEEKQHTGESRITFKSGGYMDFPASVESIKSWFRWGEKECFTGRMKQVKEGAE